MLENCCVPFRKWEQRRKRKDGGIIIIDRIYFSQRVSEKLGEKAKKRNWESKGKKEVSYFREIHRWLD